MATTIINPAASTNSAKNNSMGFLLGAIALVVLLVIFFVYVLPYMRGLGGSGGVQINVPKSIDVKVQQTK